MACKRWLTHRTLVALAYGLILTFVLAIYLISYRGDYADYFHARNFVPYPPESNDAHKAFVWVHRILSYMWAFLIVLQLLILFCCGKAQCGGSYDKFWHRCFGYAIVFCDALNVVTGLTALGIEPFDNQFTIVFVILNAIINVVLIVVFLIDKCCPSLNSCPQGCVWTICCLRGTCCCRKLDRKTVVERNWHPYLGFAFSVSVFGAAVQFFIFWSSVCHLCLDRDADLFLYNWNLSLGLAMLLAPVCTGLLMVIYFCYIKPNENRLWLYVRPRDYTRL